MINSNSQPISRTSSIDSTTGERRTLSRDVDVMKSRMVSGERQISISSNRPATTILATDHLLNPNHDPDRISTCCGLKLTGNAKTLLISTFLFLTITTGQYFAAIAASSIALKADCVSMLVDALSYIGNLFAECTPNPDTKKG
ncbi:hypothetical protein TL16_g02295 [Triparma laevis f. inornata]|uniref:Uncharacterized protein n=1 Tax=Triparma laevis f. inornata TaxID=1714386 RepID=A0A9W6ZM39_9STRA|nr:hypothetical protein TL16_g02295 [Triparma laevis f. inornata]